MPQLRDRAVGSMADIESYRAVLEVGEGLTVTIEYARPDSYRTLFRAQDVEPGDDLGVAETVFVGDTVYSRRCDTIDTDCGPWSEAPREGVIVGGPSSAYFPQWPLVALELADAVDFAGQESMDGAPVIRVHGSVNHLRAIVENQRRLFSETGISSFGRECTAEAALPGTPQPTEECHDTRFEDLLEQEADDLAYADSHPATIDAWIDQDTSLVRRIEIVAPQEDDEDLTVTVEYSNFNEIQIGAPQ